MTRRLFAVALLPCGSLASGIDGLRRLVADPRRGDLPTHLTLVPPIALDESGVAGLPVALGRAARSVSPFELELGPAASFAPRTSTLHLAVGGQLDRLSELRDALRVEPLDRPDEHDFVPHVTLLQRATPAQVGAGLTLLSSTLQEWQVGSLTLLERLRPESGPVWHPVAEEPLGGPRVVGRGGVELHLRSGSVLTPAVAALTGWTWPPLLPAGGATLVASAELRGAPGEPVGAAIGRADAQGAVLDHVVVAGAHRGQGIARHVVGEWCREAVERGAGVVAARPTGHSTDGAAASDPGAFLGALGFTAIDATTWSRRVGPLGEVGSPA
jgi:2'-5' RNA ligase/GNAT superfamily N-acetyltransferase